MLWVKMYYKHFMLVFYVRINKIKNMGNIILVLVVGETKKKKKGFILFVLLDRKMKERRNMF